MPENQLLCLGKILHTQTHTHTHTHTHTQTQIDKCELFFKSVFKKMVNVFLKGGKGHGVRTPSNLHVLQSMLV